MRIGILTLHDSTNYGAVLQAYALYSVLTRMGHDVRIVDRRRSPQMYAIAYPYSGDSWIISLCRYFSFTGAFIEAVHRRRTYLFERNNMKFTPYCFHDWRDVPKDLGLDLIVFGSDQIWNKYLQDPLDYTLARVPNNIPGITYAASMGMPNIPEELRHDFATLLPKFASVSVREASLISQLDNIGIMAAHVIDPVGLVECDFWRRYLCSAENQEKQCKGKTFVYTLGMEELGSLLRKMNTFACNNSCSVEVFPCRHLLPLPNFYNLKGVLRLPWNIMHWIRIFSHYRVRVRLMAGPKQFLKSLSLSENVITNSFHALLFGALLGKNVRYVVPKNKSGKDMMVRIYDYVGVYFGGPIIQASVDDALRSIERGEKSYVEEDKLDIFRKRSKAWLETTIHRIIEKGTR